MSRHFRIFPRMKTSQRPWATCTTALSPSPSKRDSLCSEVTSCFSICAHCLLSLRQLVQNLSLSSLLTPSNHWCIGVHIGEFPSEPFFHTEMLSPFSISSYMTGSSPLIISVTLCWPDSSSSISLWPWEAQNSLFLYIFSVLFFAGAPCSSTQASWYFSFLLTGLDSS